MLVFKVSVMCSRNFTTYQTGHCFRAKIHFKAARLEPWACRPLHCRACMGGRPCSAICTKGSFG